MTSVRILHSAEQLSASFADAVESAQSIHVAVAWITSCEQVSQLVRASERKVPLEVIVARDPLVTEPASIRALARVGKCSWAPEPVGGIFHPKVYRFDGPTETTVLVGSANLTRRAFTTNTEVVTELRGPANSFFDLDTFFRERRSGEYVDEVAVDEFGREAVDQRKRRQTLEFEAAETDKAATDAAVQEAERRLAGRRLLDLSWDEYFDALRHMERLWRPFGVNIDGYLNCLELLTPLCGRDIKSLRADEREALLGMEQIDYPDAPHLGRLRRATKARDRFKAGGSFVAPVAAALAQIPTAGAMTQPSALSAYSQLDALDGFGTAVITRLLTLRRPDKFMTVNTASQEVLSQIFDISVPALRGQKGYLRALASLWRAPWMNSQEPRDRAEREVWLRRAALLDLFAYRPSDGYHPDAEVE